MSFSSLRSFVLVLVVAYGATAESGCNKCKLVNFTMSAPESNQYMDSMCTEVEITPACELKYNCRHSLKKQMESATMDITGFMMGNQKVNHHIEHVCKFMEEMDGKDQSEVMDILMKYSVPKMQCGDPAWLNAQAVQETKELDPKAKDAWGRFAGDFQITMTASNINHDPKAVDSLTFAGTVQCEEKKRQPKKH